MGAEPNDGSSDPQRQFQGNSHQQTINHGFVDNPLLVEDLMVFRGDDPLP